MDPRKVSRAVLIVTGLAAAGVLAWRLQQPAENDGVLPMGDYGAVAEFRLKERSGKAVGLGDLKGKVWVADFIFTRCNGPCPFLSKRMARLQEIFAAEPRVRFVSFSVDPAYDTPEVLATYAARFGADKERWLFLTGKTEEVHDLVLTSFRLALKENAPPGGAPGEEVTHSLDFVLVDGEGRIRGYYAGDDKRALSALKKNIEDLL